MRIPHIVETVHRIVLQASGLLRQLLADGGLVPLHGQMVFLALRVAMSDPAQVGVHHAHMGTDPAFASMVAVRGLL